MTLYPIILVAVILVADSLGLADGLRRMDGWAVTAMTVLPVIAVVVAVALLVRRCHRRLRNEGQGARAVIAAGKASSIGRWLVVLLHANAVLALGWLGVVRGVVGNLILVDELICLVPPVLGLLGLWWAQYPIERRVREAMVIDRLETGRPVYGIPSRAQYVLHQARSGLLLLLLPLVLILALVESIDVIGRQLTDSRVPLLSLDIARVLAVAGVFIVSPLLARLVLTVRPMAEGPVREDMVEICRRHRVKVRQILLWDTGGCMINAAVMGLLGPLRYVLMTDGLLDSMSRSQVQAVMAHEIAHVRRRHIPWLVVCLMAALAVTTAAVELTLGTAQWAGWTGPGYAPGGGMDAAMAVGRVGAELALALVVFGWVSRRFERQADTFAVQHLSGLGLAVAVDERPTVTPEAVQAMNSALRRIAQLNFINPRRHSWRHGAIEWRRGYLDSLVGRPVHELAIDRLIRRIKLAAAATLVISIGALTLQPAAPMDGPAGMTLSTMPAHGGRGDGP
jgi:STE24 endopeptidase